MRHRPSDTAPVCPEPTGPAGAAPPARSPLSTPAPVVSVVMASHNGERWIAEAVGSVLAQRGPALELIVCDDGSNDGTRGALEGFGSAIRVVRQDQHGVSAARNRAAALARGEFLAFLDQDDLWEPELLESQVARLRRNPTLGLVYADSWVIDAEGRRRSKRSRHLRSRTDGAFLELLRGNFVPLETTVMRRALFCELGGFDERLHYLEDWDLCLRVARCAPVASSRRCLASYRLHDRNLTHDMGRIVQEYAAALGELRSDCGLAPEARRIAAAEWNRRRGELAWISLRAGRGSEARGWLTGVGRLRPGLRTKLTLLNALLDRLPRAARLGLLACLPARRLYGQRRPTTSEHPAMTGPAGLLGAAARCNPAESAGARRATPTGELA